MGYLRALASVVLLASVVFFSARVSSASSLNASPAGCTPALLAEAFSGPFQLKSIDAFGCSGAWAYAWATVGTGPQEVSVTEVLRYNAGSAKWAFVSRQQYCRAGLLPRLVYEKGCFSN
jgi:hypothetical protein